jgi:D-alanine-D-alanine ligase-like ATP-grasp enzyme
MRPVGAEQRDAVRIAAVSLVRYVGPRESAFGIDPPYGLVVRLRSDDGTTGLGESWVGPTKVEQAWQLLQETGQKLIGSVVPLQPAGLDEHNPISGTASHARGDAASRAAHVATELALLDLVLRSAGRSPADEWGTRNDEVGSQPQPTLALPDSLSGPGADQFLEALRMNAGTWAMRVSSTGDVRHDLAWLEAIARIEATAGRARPLWLVHRGRPDLRANTKLVGRLARLLRAEKLPPQVMVEVSALPTELSDLQKKADKLLRSRRNGSRAPMLSVVATGGMRMLDQLRRLPSDGRTVGAVCLSLAGCGGWLGLRQAAVTAKRADPSMVVLLDGETRGSDITASAVAALATVTPEIDQFLPAVPRVTWPTLLSQSQAVPPDSKGGLYPELDVRSLAAVADRFVEFPSSEPTAARETPNQFDDHLLPGARLGLSSPTILEVEALRRGLRTRRFAEKLFVAEQETTRITMGFEGPQSSATSIPAAAIATHKGLTRSMLAEHGVPVAPGRWLPIDGTEDIHAAAKELGYPLVVKPADGIKGHAVTTGITSDEQLEQALQTITESRYGSAGVVLERMVYGADYRLLATARETISVVRRDPAAVTGDGRHTVAELILAANVARRRVPHLAKRLIPLDARIEKPLSGQGLTLMSVPPDGQQVYLSHVANLSQGGTSREVLDSTHPSILELAAAAVAAIPGLPYGGVDILMDDHRKPADDQNIAVIEINHNPAMLLHHYPMYGPPRSVCKQLLAEVAADAGIVLGPRSDLLTVGLTVTGVTSSSYSNWLARAAEQLSLDGWVGHPDEKGRVTARVHGPPFRVGALLRLAFAGPPGVLPAATLVNPVRWDPTPGFAVRNSRGGGE